MNLIIREAKIIDPQSRFHQQVVDVAIENGILKQFGTKLPAKSSFEELKLDNLHLSQGWFDSSVSMGEPGFEDCETIANGLHVAAKSGFTGIALQPNTFPVLDNQSQILFVKEKAKQELTEVFPIGAFTKNASGTDLAELFDMKNAGAIAFGDYNNSLSNANLLKIGLQYAQDFDGLIIAYCQDEKIAGSGVVHEGIVSTQLGLKGIPTLAEELILARNINLLEYTGGKLHIPTISTAKSVELIKQAKAKGLQITCSVAVHHLVLTDETLLEFDTRYKVTPPLRDESNRKALLAGVLDGTIDCITSDHNPITIEHKKMEFDTAKNGTIGLESAFGALQNVLPLDIVISKLTAGRTLFGLESPVLEEGRKANLTLFNPNETWQFSKASIASKSKNSAFLGQPMTGKVYGIYTKGILKIN